MSRIFDRAVITPGAEILFAVVGLLAGVGLSIYMQEPIELRLTLFLATAFAAFSFWSVTTWRRLWRSGSNHWERIVFDVGVKQFGPFAWIGAALVFSIGLWYESRNIKVAIFFFVWFFFSLPLWLWMGYLWGVTMAAFQGVKRSPRT